MIGATVTPRKPQRRHHRWPGSNPKAAEYRPARTKGIAIALVGLAAVAQLPAAFGEDTMVISHVFNGYERQRQPDGHYRSETYVFAEGGLLSQERVDGDSVEVIGFDEVAHTVADALRSQNFVAGSDTDKIEQLIMVWYGTLADIRGSRVIPNFKDTPMNRAEKARILGWERDLSRAADLMWSDVGRSFLTEYNAGRYFVVLKAYDFQIARNEKRLKPLWESRFSIQRQGLDFRAELPALASSAAVTFGKETGGILHREPPEGRVEIGDIEVVEEPRP